MKITAVTANSKQYEILRLNSDLKIFNNYTEFLDFSRKKSETSTVAILEIVSAEGSIFSFAKSNPSFIAGTPFIVVCPYDDVDIARKCYELGASLVVKNVEDINLMRAFIETMNPEREINDIHIMTGFSCSKLEFTKTEERILRMFARNKNSKCTRVALEEVIWNGQKRTKKNLEVHIQNIKKKINTVGYTIHRINEDYQIKVL